MLYTDTTSRSRLARQLHVSYTTVVKFYSTTSSRYNTVHPQTRSNSSRMSFSNADTGSKPADPYTAKNFEEPSLKEKVEDLGAFVDKSKFCLMTTHTADGKLVTRAMALAAKEGNGVDFIFHANSESGKTDDLEANSEVNLGFLNNSGEWASISGDAKIVTERETVRKYYSPALKAWLGDLGDGKHDGGPEDPRIIVIKVVSKTVQYAVSRNTAIGSTIEMVKGVITGEAPAVNKLRHLDESELQKVRAS
nr:protein bli-3 [Quercus suber]